LSGVIAQHLVLPSFVDGSSEEKLFGTNAVPFEGKKTGAAFDGSAIDSLNDRLRA